MSSINHCDDRPATSVAADWNDAGMQKLQHGDLEGAEELLRKALDSRLAAAIQPQAEQAGEEEDDWETELEDNLQRLNVALNGKVVTPSRPAEATSSNSSTTTNTAARQFRGRGTIAFGTQAHREGGEQQPGRRNLPHVLEFYNLTGHTTTADIEAFLKPLRSHPVEAVVQWVDEQHALVLFPTANSAREVLEHRQHTFKIRPFSEASEGSRDKTDSELLAPKLRPKTTDVVARRLLSHALGRSDLLDKQGEQRLAKARKDHRQERVQREQQLSSAWGDE